MSRFNILFIGILFLLPSIKVDAQNDTLDYFKKDYLRFENRVYVDHIRSVKFELNGVDLSDPIIDLKGQGQLRLSFDDFLDETMQYTYTIQHCNANWDPSNIMETQYIEGFNNDQIVDYDFSFNTLQPYTHFYLLFPNNRVSPKIA
ncbi:MAG: DUF5103 domain-containing protein, partial [Bacteroidia bacterium]|nr:DUF5103 domain-containing protein [Bacteroidia bacterium]